jgi:hypothetical protein
MAEISDRDRAWCIEKLGDILDQLTLVEDIVGTPLAGLVEEACDLLMKVRGEIT